MWGGGGGERGSLAFIPITVKSDLRLKLIKSIPYFRSKWFKFNHTLWHHTTSFDNDDDSVGGGGDNSET